ncbi:hypothetical protein D9M72_363240 [compost metagenome]
MAPDLFEFVGEFGELSTAGHLGGELVEGDVLLFVVADRLAALEQQEPVTDGEGVVRVVGDEDDAQAAVAGLQDVAQHHAGLLHAEGRRRLVKDQHLRAEVHGPCDRHALAFTAGELADGLLHVAEVDAHLGEFVFGDVLQFLDVQALERAKAGGQLRAEEEVPPDRHQRHHGEVLVDGGDADVEGVSRGGELPFLAHDLQDALVVLVQAGDDLDQGGLAGAVVAQDAGNAAIVHGHRDVGQGDDVAIAFADPVQREQMHRGVRQRVGFVLEQGLLVNLFGIHFSGPFT